MFAPISMGQNSVSSVHLPILKVYLNVYKLGNCDELGLSEKVLTRPECVTLSQGKPPPGAKWETRPLPCPAPPLWVTLAVSVLGSGE